MAKPFSTIADKGNHMSTATAERLYTIEIAKAEETADSRKFAPLARHGEPYHVLTRDDIADELSRLLDTGYGAIVVRRIGKAEIT